MHHTSRLCAIAVALSSCTAAGGQATDIGALPGAVRAQVQNERFQIVAAVRGLPLGVRDGLQTLFGTHTLDIADPDAPFQRGTTAPVTLPIRRLAVAGCAIDLCLVYYERGGSAHTWRVAIFHWTPAATRFEWGGAAPGGLTTIEEVRGAILSGLIKPTSEPW